MTEFGLRLGAVSFKLVPLYAYWRPHFKGWLVIPLVLAGIYLRFLHRTRIAASLTDRHAMLAFSGYFVLISLGVAMLDGGPRSLIAPLLRTDLEYFGAVGAVGNVAAFLRDFPERASTMPMHAQVHPPGAVLFLWAVCRVLGSSPWAAAAGIILFSSLCVPMVFAWARRVGGPGVARRAAALFVWTPSFVLFTATSMDGPFAVALIATMWLFWEALHRRPAFFGSLAGLAASAAAMLTYSVTVALLFCGIATLLLLVARPAERPTTLRAAVYAAASFLVSHAIVSAATGYDPIHMFLAAVANHKHIMAGARHESLERYALLSVGNLAVFFIGVGLSCTIFWWSSVVRFLNDWWTARNIFSFGTSQQFTLVALLTLIIAAIVPVYVLEVERVWMFLVPVVVIPVAQQLFEHERSSNKFRNTIAVMLTLAAQTVITEVLLTTYW